jgi:hypothetical protein
VRGGMGCVEAVGLGVGRKSKLACEGGMGCKVE